MRRRALPEGRDEDGKTSEGPAREDPGGPAKQEGERRDNVSIESNMTRRGFLRGSLGLAAAGMAAGGLATASAAFAHAEDGAQDGEVVRKGHCAGCFYAKCTQLYHVKDGVLTYVEGDPDGLYNKGKCCVRGASTPMRVYNPYRVKTPLKRTNPEKGLDVDPGWVEITWDEAMDEIAERLIAIRKDNPNKLMYLPGFPSWHNPIVGAGWPFATVFGTANVKSATGSLCSVHVAAAHVHGEFVQTSEMNYAKYVLLVGATLSPNHGVADAGTDFVIDQIEKGTRLVCVDPRCGIEASLGEWVPIKPATDLAFLEAVTHSILFEVGRFDEWFVKNRTNAPYLMNPEGDDYVRDAATGKPLVWDVAAGAAKTFDDPSVGDLDYALEGTFTVDGAEVQPAFQYLLDAVRDYTPEWAEEITTVPAGTIRQIARDLVDYAQIGSTVEINGHTLPLRPAHVNLSRGCTCHRDGQAAFWMGMVINELLGAVAVPGGNTVLNYNGHCLQPDEDGIVISEATGLSSRSPYYAWQYPPQALDYPELIPYSYCPANRYIWTLLDPEKYHMGYMPEMFISFGSSLFSKGGDPEVIAEALAKIPFMVHYTYAEDEMAMMSDIILPDRTNVEQNVFFENAAYRPGNGELGRCYVGHTQIIEPVYGQMHPDDFFLQLADKVGFLRGNGMNCLEFAMNKRWGLDAAHELDTTRSYTIDEMQERRMKNAFGDEASWDVLAETGYYKVELEEQDQYNYSAFPGKQTRHPLYNIAVVKAKKQLQEGLAAAGIDYPLGQEFMDDIEFYYQGFPQWKPTPVMDVGEGFDLNGVVFKIPQFLFDVSGCVQNPLLVETAYSDDMLGKILLNPATAERKGLADGDMVYVQSQYGTEIGPYPVKVTELVHPDAMGVAGGNARYSANLDPLVERHVKYNKLMSTAYEAVDVVSGGLEVSPAVRLVKA